MEELFLVTIVTLVASFLGTISGFGISTILVPFLLFFFPFAETLLIAGILHWFNDIWKMLLFKKGIEWKLILTFGIPSVIASSLGALLIFEAPGTVVSRILGLFFVLYGAFLLAYRSFKLKKSNGIAIAGGAASGFVTGITGVGGPLRAVFLSAFKLPKAVYLATIGAIAFATDSVRILTYHFEGARLPTELLLGLIVFVPASYIGAKLAERSLTKIPDTAFRLVIAIFLIVVGINFVLFP